MSEGFGAGMNTAILKGENGVDHGRELTVPFAKGVSDCLELLAGEVDVAAAAAVASQPVVRHAEAGAARLEDDLCAKERRGPVHFLPRAGPTTDQDRQHDPSTRARHRRTVQIVINRELVPIRTV